MKTEYLITFDSTDCICTNVGKFKSLLVSHDAISFDKKDIIKFGGQEYNYKLAQGKLTDGSIYYDMTLECLDKGSIESYSEFLKEIRRVCTKLSGRQIIVLHDGLGEEYCKMGYPVIYKTENLMRKLISKFMAISIGYDWRDLSTPNEVLESIRLGGGDKRERTNFLHEVDFIQLSNFLFKKYTKSDANKFIESMSGKEDSDQISVSEIRRYYPFTNWEKYFSKRVNCDSDYLRSRWEKLYEYRCKIAHCRTLTRIEFDDLTLMANDFCEKIQAALDSVGDVHVEKAEREELAENLSGTANQDVALFINRYNGLLDLMRFACEQCSNDDDVYYKSKTNETNIKMQSRYLQGAKGIIDSYLVDVIDKVQEIRNSAVHKAGISPISDAEIANGMELLNYIYEILGALKFEELKKLRGIDVRK